MSNLSNEVANAAEFKQPETVSVTPSNFTKFRAAIIHFFDKLVNGAQPKHYDYKILFGAQAAGLGEHGRIVGTWVKEGHRNPISITFFVEGFNDMPPQLDAHLFEELYAQAAFNGIVLSHISGYAALSVIRTNPGPRMSGVQVHHHRN